MAVIYVLGSNPDLGLRGHQAQYILCMFSSDLCINPLMSRFRILFALNTVNLILDTVGGWVNIVFVA